MCLQTQLYCQSTDSLKLKKHHIGISFSPDYSFRILKSDANTTFIKNTLDTLEVAKLGYTTGLNYTYSFSKKISIATGFLLSNKGEKTKKTFSSVPAKFNYNNQYYYIDIPIKANYYLIHKKVKLFVTAGLSTNVFLVQKTSQITGYTNDDVKNNFYNKTDISAINFVMLAGFGIDCPLYKSWSFKLEPLYRRSVTPTTNTAVKKYLYSVGLNVGFYKAF